MRPLISLASLTVATLATAAQPNVVLILADDLGQRDLGCYGSTFHKTPHIDALAARGMSFSQAYSASPLCSPTRASILTGLAPARIGITSPVCHLGQVVLKKELDKPNTRLPYQIAASLTRLDTTYTTLPEVLLAAGWQTGHLGKWHLGSEPYSPLQHGFQTDLPHTPGPGPGGNNGYFAPWAFWPEQGKPGEHIEDRMALEAEKFIAAHKTKPFFLNYWAFSVHGPWMAKEDYVADAEQRVDKAKPQQNAMYAGMLKSLDEAVGRITAALEQNGVADNTLILFTGDNGGFPIAPRKTPHKAWADVPVTSNAPHRSGKASVYEGGTRVPLLAVWPGKIPAGSKSDAVVQSTDFFPTLLELLQLPKPANVTFDGQSIAPALQGKPVERPAIYCHFPHGDERAAIDGQRPASWVRKGDWKLIRFYASNADGTDRLELYNLADDLSETNNLAAAKPEHAAELNTMLAKYLKDTQAVVPIRNPQYQSASAPTAKAKDPLLGWKARECTAAVTNGILKTTQASKGTFLGMGVKLAADQSKLIVRLKTTATAGQIGWLDKSAASKALQTTDYAVTGTDWQEITSPIPASKPGSGILRMYMPADAEIDWIELHSGAAKPQRWDF
jgi:arylsulfatase A-like enzyme